MRSRDELNTLHLHLQLTYDHQARHGGVSNEGLTNSLITRLFDHVVTVRSPEKLGKSYTSTFPRPRATKPGRGVASRIMFRTQKLKSCQLLFFFNFYFSTVFAFFYA